MNPSAHQIVLDTSIVLQLARGNEYGSRINKAYGLDARAYPPLISIVTVGELLAFAKRRDWGPSRVAALQQIIHRFVVVDINRPVTERFAEIDAFLVNAGKAVGDNDVWIAATAAATGALLITTDKDFEPLAKTYIELSLFSL